MGTYRQYGAFNSNVATFLRANLAAFIICCGSEFGSKLGSKHPKRVSNATRPIPTDVKLQIITNSILQIK